MFELNKVGKNTYYIENPVKIGVYDLGSGEVCLIDSGNDTRAAKKISAVIEENGWRIKTIINTHSHADHCGGNAYLQEKYGCNILSAPIEAAFISHPILEPEMLYGGFPDDSLRGKFLMAEPSRCDAITNENLPRGLEFTYLNGHCTEMIGIRTDDDIWFLGDCVSREEILQKYHISVTLDVAEFLRTLDKIITLSGKLFIPSHTQTLTDLHGIAELNRRKVLEICDVILQICAAPKTSEQIIKELFIHYNMMHTVEQHALIGYTVRSYLSYLVMENKLKKRIEDDLLVYERA